ncbi:WXG100 family type VII secretion target [Arthrobacter sp. H35-D1]|uniref:WXG100 family type VII secretion target n=1 Tax=Arthrobacter sp. H35-D1 TaxID=3046202 RepID=UPI0024BA5190|nr:WXG100 family type VII secretion target [Arthrobacter sp. H35-D1]MDJ0311694.1 WXG100 family type VII secretion target [Arthrobacter sp. H35-D1]
MPGEFLGSDPVDLRALAKDFQGASASLRRIQFTLTSVAGSVAWHGPDAEHFRQTWSSHKKVITSVCQGLENASKDLARNADEQDQASSVGSLSGKVQCAGTGGTPSKSQLDKLDAMTPEERLKYLGSAEFKKWAAQNPDDAKATMDAAVASGLIPVKSEEYKDFLSGYWNNMAMERMGIGPATWDTSKGTAANWDTIKKVYDFYGQQFLANPDLQWAGMANMIGPSFAGGFKDMDMIRSIAREIVNGPIKNIPLADLQMLRAAAAMTDQDVKFYETAMLDMNKEIFLDQARQHMAYENGGMTEINRLAASGAITPETAKAWEYIDSKDPAKVQMGNTMLLDREQNKIIANDYDNMYKHPVTGPAVTYMVTLVGEPSIPGAKSYPEVFPLIVPVETPGTTNIPFTPWDNPLQGTVEITTPLPDGNIANADQRWDLIKQATLPAYQRLLAEDPERAREIVASDFNGRVEQARPTNNIGPITTRIVTGFEIGFKQ